MPARVPVPVAVPAALVVGLLGAAELRWTTVGIGPGDLVAACTAVVAVATLAASHRTGGLLAVLAGVVGVAAATQPRLVPAVVGLVGVWLLVRRGLPATAVVAGTTLAAVLAWLAGPLRHVVPGGDITPLLLVLVPVTTTVAAVALARRRREQTQAAEDRARRREIEVQRGEATRSERARISRELHDLVAHSVSVVASLAEAAPYTVPELSPAARTRFVEIGDAARGALGELRDLLAVLRRDEIPGAPAGGLGPSAVPDLAGIERLADEHRRTGHSVELHLDPATGDVGIPVEIAAHRIVQEALSNVRRHADAGAHTRVVVGRDGDTLRVLVHDSGPSRAGSHGSGHGLLGIRERAEVLRGTMSAGPVDGGFAVRVEVPAVRRSAEVSHP